MDNSKPSRAKGRTATYYIREAIQERLEDLEDIYFAEVACKKLKKGKDEVLSGKEFWRDMEN